jgi:hypothetical protein
MVSLNLDDDLSTLTVDVLPMYPEKSETIRMGYTKTRFMGTRVSGRRVNMLMPAMVVFEKVQYCEFRTTGC